MNFFFDLINEVAGYTEKHYDEVIEKFSTEDLIQKYRAHRNLPDNDPAKIKLLGGDHPHCLMVIEGVHQLYRMKNDLARDYLDAMILRLYVSLAFT